MKTLRVQMSFLALLLNASSVMAQLPDLAPLSLTWDRVPTAGQTVTVTAALTNRGDGFVNSGISDRYDRVTLSTTATTNGAVGQWDGNFRLNINPHTAYTLSLAVPLPGNISAGPYYLIWEADARSLVAEGDETNNALAVPVNIVLPDLAPLSLTWDRVPTAGQRFVVTVVVTNKGDGLVAPYWYDRISLSPTPSTNQAVYRRDFQIYRSVQPHTSFTVEVDFGVYLDIPGNVAAGTNYIIYEVDENAAYSHNYVPESNETNNTLVVPVNIVFPDYQPLSVTPDRVPTAGQRFFVTAVVTNQSDGLVTSGSYDRVSLSPTPSTNEAVYRRDFQLIGPVQPHSAYSVAGYVFVDVPGTLAPGINYLIYETDSLGHVPESNETNNTLVVPISVGIGELVPTSLRTNSLAIAGRPLSVSWGVSNPSTNALIGGWNDQLVLSTNMTTNGAIVVWPYYGSFNVAGGGAYSLTRTVDVPQIRAGDYFLILQVDAGGVVPESNETNNTRSLAISVTNIPPRVSLLAPTNSIERKICVPASFPLAAKVEMGSYSIRRVEFLTNGVEATLSANVPYRAITPSLAQGVYRITAQVVDVFDLRATSPQEAVITLAWPNLLELLAELDRNRDVVCCMGANVGSNYIVEATAHFNNSTIPWQPHLTNRVFGPALVFTNRPTKPQEFYRARQEP